VRDGVRLGVDVGTVRVGLARSDPAGLLATPLETVARRGRVSGADLTRIAELVTLCEAMEIVVGLPRSLSGDEGASAQAARAYAVAIARRVSPVPVRLVDERLSTVSAHQHLRAAGVKARRQRPVVDQAAAVVILQSALDAERASGRPPGSLADPEDAPAQDPARGDQQEVRP
jgi:putative Holliday junction resolvase